MLETIPNLWSSTGLKSKVLKPIAILRVQASQLSPMTEGVLRSEVTTVKGERQEILNLDIIAPTLHNFRHRLLSVQYDKEQYYPVKVSAQGLSVTEMEEVEERYNPLSSQPRRWKNPQLKPVQKSVESKEAHSEDEFIKILKEVLQAPETVAFLQTLIVRSNEMTEAIADTNT